MFLVGKPKKEFRTLNHERGVVSFDTAIIVMSMGRYDAALINLISSLEAFLSTEQSINDSVDKRSFWAKITNFNEINPRLISNYRKYSEHYEDPKKLIYDVYELRNRILHSGHSPEHNNIAAEAILRTLFPMIQSIYEILFQSKLIDHLNVQITEHFNTSQYLSRNHQFNEDDWVVGLWPITWSAQHYISPNFEPKYHWNENGERIDDSEKIYEALSNVKANLDERGQYCPICAHDSVALEYGLRNNGKKPHEIVIEEALCVYCQLNIGSGPAEKALSSALFDSLITENEPKLVKEFGL